MVLSTIKVIILDDHHLFTEGILSMFANHEFIQVIAKVSNYEELQRSFRNGKPDLLLLDIKIPVIDGIQILRALRANGEIFKIIMLTTYADYKTVNTCKNLGANGYLLKNTTKEELENVVLNVMQNESVFPGLIDNPDSDVSKYEFYAKKFKITKREWELLLLIKEAKTNLQISDELKLSIYTVETHRKNIMQKLNLKSSGSLIRFLLENGI